MRKVYYLPECILDTKVVVFVLDGDKLLLERYDHSLIGKSWATAPWPEKLKDFEPVTGVEFHKIVEAQAAEESIQLFSKKYNLLYGPKIFRLCYVDAPWAYFTTQELEKQWGDDWNDAPYEHNAGEPYRPHKELSVPIRNEKCDVVEWCKTSEYVDDVPGWEIKKVAFEGSLETPSSIHGYNSPWSVEQINRGAVAWLQDRYGYSDVVIPAGTTLEDFKKLVAKAGGKVYE